MLTFASSCLTISLYCINLIQELFQEDALVLWNLWDQLKKIKTEGKSKAQNQQMYLSEIYALPANFAVSSRLDILKLQNVKQKSLTRLKKLNILMSQ